MQFGAFDIFDDSWKSWFIHKLDLLGTCFRAIRRLKDILVTEALNLGGNRLGQI